VLGLGVSHAHLAERLRGHTYDRPLTRMREYLAAYRSAVYRGPMLDDGDEPPVLVAALRERMLGLAATDADGAFPYLITPERVAWTRGVLDAAATSAVRPRPVLAVSMPAVLEPDPDAARATARAYLTPYLRTPNYQACWAEQGFAEVDWEKPGSDRLVDAMVAQGDAGALRARAAELFAAGADHVAVIGLAPDGNTEHLPVLEAVAEQGFVEADWEKPGSDRLVDAMVAQGDAGALRARAAELFAAGADHVAVIGLAPDGTTEHLPVLEAVAGA